MGVESEINNLRSASGIVTVDVSAADHILAKPCRSIMVGVAGDVAVVMADGGAGTVPALNPGVMYPISAKTIVKTGTTATGIRAFL